MLKCGMALMFLIAASMLQDSEVQIKPSGKNEFELTLEAPAGDGDAAAAAAKMQAAVKHVCEGVGVAMESPLFINMERKKPPRAKILQIITCKTPE